MNTENTACEVTRFTRNVLLYLWWSFVTFLCEFKSKMAALGSDSRWHFQTM